MMLPELNCEGSNTMQTVVIVQKITTMCSGININFTLPNLDDCSK